MGYPLQPPHQSVPTYSPTAYSQTHTARPGSSQAPVSSTELPEGHSDFSLRDAAWVVMRTLSTATECLHFVCRKVTVYLGMIIGGLKGLLQYAHENLENRTIQQTPPRVSFSPVQQTSPHESHQVPASPTPKNRPWEDYVETGAKRVANYLKKPVLTRCANTSWMAVGGVAIALAVTGYMLGIPGVMFLYIPRNIAEPYNIFDEPTDKPLSRQALPQTNPAPQVQLSGPPLPPQYPKPSQPYPSINQPSSTPHWDRQPVI